jgi:hypothetical protein
MVKEFGGRIKWIQLQIDTKVVTKMIRSMDKVNLFGNQAIPTKVITNMMKEMVMVKCILQMEQFTKATGIEVFNVDKLKCI